MHPRDTGVKFPTGVEVDEAAFRLGETHFCCTRCGTKIKDGPSFLSIKIQVDFTYYLIYYK